MSIAKCPCQHCNIGLEFDGEGAGQSITCPSCGLETRLFIPPKTEKPKWMADVPLAKIVQANALKSLRDNIREQSQYQGTRIALLILLLLSLMGDLILAAKSSDSGSLATFFPICIATALMSITGYLLIIIFVDIADILLAIHGDKNGPMKHQPNVSGEKSH